MPHTSTAITRELQTIRTSFRQLARSFSRLAPVLGKGAMSMATVQEDTKRPRKKPRLSVATRAALKLQGKYMGTMRGLKPRQRAKVKTIRAERGIKAAIKTAERMAG
jgi:hypothetical protein